MLKLIGSVGAIALFALIDGWVLSALWGWFVVPLGVVPIGVAQAIGLSVTVAWLTNQYSDWDSGDFIKDMTKRVSWYVALLLIVTVVGFLAHTAL